MKNNIHGVDHIGLTVPDLEEATRFLIAALDAEVLYETHKKSAPPQGSDFTQKRLGIDGSMEEQAIRMLVLPNGPQLELFEFGGGKQKDPATPADLGWQHIAVYVDDMAAALQQVEAAGGKRNADPIALSGLEEGEGNLFCYCRTPWGSTLELITYPSRQPYLGFSKRRKWQV